MFMLPPETADAPVGIPQGSICGRLHFPGGEFGGLRFGALGQCASLVSGRCGQIRLVGQPGVEPGTIRL